MVAGAQSRLTFLAADLLSAAQPSPTPLQKTRVGGFRRHASGQTSSRRRCRSIITPGSRGCVYKTMSGRHEWLNRDPIQEAGGLNLYRFVANNPINRVDPLGLADHIWDIYNENDPDPVMAQINKQSNQQADQQNQAMIDQQSAVERQLLGNTAATTAVSLLNPEAGLYYALALAQMPDQTSGHCPNNGSGNPAMIGSMGNFKNLSPNQLNGIDAHQLKSDFVGPENISKFNISVDDNGNITLVPRNPGAGANVETGFKFSELPDIYPLGE